MIQRTRKRTLSGEGKLGCILWLLFFAISGMAAVKMVPVRIDVGQLRDYMGEQAKFGGRNSDNIKKAIVNRGKELGLPVTADKVKVDVSRERVKMDVQFVVPVEFPGYTYYWNFDLVLDEARFVFN